MPLRYRLTLALIPVLLLTSCSALADGTAAPSTPNKQVSTPPPKSTTTANTAVPSSTATEADPEVTATTLPITEQPTEAGSNIINWMMADAAIRTDTPPTAILIQSIEPVDWPDAGLGCPAPDRDYAQVVTPGFRVTLSVRGEDYIYHADRQDNFVLCRNGQPQAPVEDFAEIWG